MQQLTQELKSGKMEILEVPFPAIDKGRVLVRNFYSVISAGTEGKTVSDARKGYIAKARSRKKEFNQVIDMIKKNGLLSTYSFVMNKLEMPSALGYSSAGEVISVGESVNSYKVGDFVACSGSNAVHAEVVSVPLKMCVKLPPNIDKKQASFVSLAAIAIQGVRQSGVTIGEKCVVIGMGVIGQLTYKILEASGVTPIGIDLSDDQIALSKSAGLLNVYNRKIGGLEEIIFNQTNGYGADSIIITASGNSSDPVEFAGKIARKRAKVVVVGNVPTGFTRAEYYKKELDLRMSTSYGPGRYDKSYEEEGIDYPVGYVRWTENRNMESFIEMLSTGKLDISKLITHEFLLHDASQAYDMILKKQEPFAGILIQYDENAELKKRVSFNEKPFSKGDVNVGFIGAGSFAQGTLLPKMKGKCNFVAIANSRGNSSRYVADKYGFSYCSENAENLLADKNINTVFITTRHNSHGDLVIKAIEKGKNVFVEKPLAITEDELKEIKKIYSNLDEKPYLFVGFNRRFAPAVTKLKEVIGEDIPKTISIRVNAGNIPSDHWVNDVNIGGGRIVGEAVHFIDLAMFIADGKIISVTANSMNDPHQLNNSVSILLEFENGSIANINYFSNGDSSLPKEHIEVFGGGMTAVINDFKSLIVYNNGVRKIRFKNQDKGHQNEIDMFFNCLRKNTPNVIPFEQSYMSSLASLLVNRSIKENRKILISDV